MQLSDIEIGYLAGLIDGEGYIQIVRRKQKYGYEYEMKISICSTDMRLVDWIVNKCGGKYYNTTPPNRLLHKPQYRWQISGKAAIGILKIVEPYSIIKRQQCEIALRFLDLKSERCPSKRDKLYSEMRIFNRRGVS